MARSFTFISIIFLVFSFSFFNCTFQNEEDYFDIEACDSTLIDRDTLNVYYEELTYIFNVCAECHNSTDTYREGIEMDNYASIKKSFETGLPWPAINHADIYKMPKDLPKLKDCEIQRIGVWIESGMPQKECDSTLIDRDTINVYYEELTYIFNVCAECHNSTDTYREGIEMDNYTSIKKSFETGLPWPAINHVDIYKMPFELPKLNDCEIQHIGVWVESGMLKQEEE